MSEIKLNSSTESFNSIQFYFILKTIDVHTVLHIFKSMQRDDYSNSLKNQKMCHGLLIGSIHFVFPRHAKKKISSEQKKWSLLFWPCSDVITMNSAFTLSIFTLQTARLVVCKNRTFLILFQLLTFVKAILATIVSLSVFCTHAKYHRQNRERTKVLFMMVRYSNSPVRSFSWRSILLWFQRCSAAKQWPPCWVSVYQRRGSGDISGSRPLPVVTIVDFLGRIAVAGSERDAPAEGKKIAFRVAFTMDIVWNNAIQSYSRKYIKESSNRRKKCTKPKQRYDGRFNTSIFMQLFTVLRRMDHEFTSTVLYQYKTSTCTNIISHLKYINIDLSCKIQRAVRPESRLHRSAPFCT